MRRLFQTMAAVVTIGLSSITAGMAHEIKAGELLITTMWSRATPGGAKVAAGYFTIANNGKAADRLVSATSPVAGKVEVHEMTMANGVMTMRPLDSGLAIEPGKTVTLAPGGFHLMLMDLKQPLKEGELLAVTLQFEKAGKVDATLHIRGVGAQAPGGGHEGHSDRKM